MLRDRVRHFKFDRPRAARDDGRRAVCGKLCYASKGVARSVAKKLRASGEADVSPGELRAYFCDPCMGWHVGHSSRGKGEGI